MSIYFKITYVIFLFMLVWENIKTLKKSSSTYIKSIQLYFTIIYFLLCMCFV